MHAELLKTQSRGRFDISMTFEGIPGLADAAVEMNFAGSFTPGTRAPLIAER